MPARDITAPTRRADAERNRDKILAAARTAFADPDAAVSMAEISRRAGVGMATLYRNFPGRQELLEALYTDEVDAVCEAAVTAGGETPGAALEAWLHRFFAFSAGKRHIASELLKQTDRSNPIFENNRTRVIAAGQPLLTAAQHAREVRGDLTLEQVLDMIVAIATIHGDTGYTEPILQTALDGLRPARDPQRTRGGEIRSLSRDDVPLCGAAPRRDDAAFRSPDPDRPGPALVGGSQGAVAGSPYPAAGRAGRGPLPGCRGL
jgi:AcrR family transcriptional regulator